MKKRNHVWVIEAAEKDKGDFEPMAHRCHYTKREAVENMNRAIIEQGDWFDYRIRKYEASDD